MGSEQPVNATGIWRTTEAARGGVNILKLVGVVALAPQLVRAKNLGLKSPAEGLGSALETLCTFNR